MKSKNLIILLSILVILCSVTACTAQRKIDNSSAVSSTTTINEIDIAESESAASEAETETETTITETTKASNPDKDSPTTAVQSSTTNSSTKKAETTGKQTTTQNTTKEQKTTEKKTTTQISTTTTQKSTTTTQKSTTTTTKPTTTKKSIDINSYISYAKSYGIGIGLQYLSDATDCWDTPIIVSANNGESVKSAIKSRLNRYYNKEGAEYFCVWAEKNEDGDYDLYIGYA